MYGVSSSVGDCGGSELGLVDRAPGEVAADRKALGISVCVGVGVLCVGVCVWGRVQHN